MKCWVPYPLAKNQWIQDKEGKEQGTLETWDRISSTPNVQQTRNNRSNGDTREFGTRLPLIQKENSVKTCNTGNSILQYGLTGNEPIHSPQNGRHFVTTPIKELLTANQRLAATLARQSLPKCHPDVFTGDVTLFHPWKSAFRAMIQHADISPAQEFNYLRNYTRGEPLKVINNYRQRQYLNPTVALQEVWTELERRFGNPAAITNVLLTRLRKAAKFGKGDNDKLQLFADVCADVDSQLDFFPGLGCLNYLSSIGPIVDSLPNSLRF